MLKFFRSKIQSLTETQLNILTAILILVNIGIVIFWINFWVSLPKISFPPIKRKPALTEQIPELLKPGKIGEIPEEEAEKKEILPLPPVVFNTSGTILEIKDDRLIIQGSGTNFTDREPREMIIIFTDTTTTFDGQKSHKGLVGLKYLKNGDLVSLHSPENIRGKTQFTIDYINKL